MTRRRIVIAHCAVCGAEFPQRWGGRPRLYCSRACRSRAYRERQPRPETKLTAEEVAWLRRKMQEEQASL